MAALQCTAERGALLEGVTCGRLSSQDGERVCWMDDLCQEAPSDEGGRCSEGPEAIHGQAVEAHDMTAVQAALGCMRVAC